jgi:hypothetical protein
MALAGDGAGTVYAVAGGRDRTLAITRLGSDGAKWDAVASLPISAASVEGSPVVPFAAVSPGGNLWLALRDRAQSGQEYGRGVIELQLPAGHAIHHRPYRENEPAPPEAIAVVGGVSTIRFVKATAADPETIWFCTSDGVSRFVGGQLAHWGENEGLDSERCHDLVIAADGMVWIATEAGVARFDGKNWRRLDDRAGGPSGRGGGSGSGDGTSRVGMLWPVNREGEGLPSRALAIVGRGLWAATPRGVWPVFGQGGSVGSVAVAAVGAQPLDRRSGLIDEDVSHLIVDRFGRLWVLGHVGVTLFETPP